MYIPFIIFKAALFSVLFVIAYLFIFRLRSRLLNRVLVSAVLLGITVFLASPDLSTRVAHRVGIGRGADLLFYLSHLGIALLVALLYIRSQELSAKVTQLTRSVALLTAKAPGQAGENTL